MDYALVVRQKGMSIRQDTRPTGRTSAPFSVITGRTPAFSRDVFPLAVGPEATVSRFTSHKADRAAASAARPRKTIMIFPQERPGPGVGFGRSLAHRADPRHMSPIHSALPRYHAPA